MMPIQPARLAAITLALLLPCGAATRSEKEFKAKDGTHIVVLPVSKLPGHGDAESRIEFYSPQNQLLCALDYSSDDSEHGFGVVKAAWTPDSNYFVFSLTSSGGHQAWHAPTLFYSVDDRGIRTLDSYVKAAKISKSDFILRPPNVVVTEAWRDQKPAPIELRLDSLTRQKTRRVLRCADGKTIKAEPYSLQPDA